MANEMVVFRRARPDAPPIEMWVYDRMQKALRAKRLFLGWWLDPVDDAERASAFAKKVALSGSPVTGEVIDNAVRRGEATQITMDEFSKGYTIERLEWCAIVDPEKIEMGGFATRGITYLNSIERAVAIYKIAGPGQTWHCVDDLESVVLGGSVRTIHKAQQWTNWDGAVKLFRDRCLTALAQKANEHHGIVSKGDLTFQNVKSEMSLKLRAAIEKKEAERRALAEKEAEEKARLDRIIANGGVTATMTNDEYAAYMRRLREVNAKFKEAGIPSIGGKR